MHINPVSLFLLFWGTANSYRLLHRICTNLLYWPLPQIGCWVEGPFRPFVQYSHSYFRYLLYTFMITSYKQTTENTGMAEKNLKSKDLHDKLERKDHSELYWLLFVICYFAFFEFWILYYQLYGFFLIVM